MNIRLAQRMSPSKRMPEAAGAGPHCAFAFGNAAARDPVLQLFTRGVQQGDGLHAV